MRRLVLVVMVFVGVGCSMPKYGATLQSLVRAKTPEGAPVLRVVQRADLEAGDFLDRDIPFWRAGSGLDQTRDTASVSIKGRALCVSHRTTLHFGDRENLDHIQRAAKNDKEFKVEAMAIFELKLYKELPTTDDWPTEQRALEVRIKRTPKDSVYDYVNITSCGELPPLSDEHNYLVVKWADWPSIMTLAVWKIEPPSASAAAATTSTQTTAPSTGDTPTSDTSTTSPSTSDGDLLATLRADARFSVFVQLLDATDLPATLSGGTYTVFAWTDSMIELAGGRDTFLGMRSDPVALRDKFLATLIAPGKVTVDAIRAGQSVTSLANKKMDLKMLGDKLFATSFEMNPKPIATNNGLIYVSKH